MRAWIIFVCHSLLYLSSSFEAIPGDFRWVHPSCQDLRLDKNGPFVILADGSLATVDDKGFSVSHDDGKIWTEPVVIARERGGQLSYPYVFERRPGELWVIADFAFKKFWQEPWPLRLKMSEQEFIEK